MSLRISVGAARWGDPMSPAALNADKGDLGCLCFKTMAAATASAARVRKRRDLGFPCYDSWLDDRMRAVLPVCLKRRTNIIIN